MSPLDFHTFSYMEPSCVYTFAEIIRINMILACNMQFTSQGFIRCPACLLLDFSGNNCITITSYFCLMMVFTPVKSCLLLYLSSFITELCVMCFILIFDFSNLHVMDFGFNGHHLMLDKWTRSLKKSITSKGVP